MKNKLSEIEMKNENAEIEPDGCQEVRERYHVFM